MTTFRTRPTGEQRIVGAGLTGSGSSMAGTAPVRVEGRAKVTGAALFSADHNVPGLLHAALVGAPVASGTVTAIDAAAALALPGVFRVLTRHEMPVFGEVPLPASAVSSLPMQTDAVRYEGEPVAIVLAETLEVAETARALVVVSCDVAPPVLPGAGTREPGPDGGPVGGAFDKGDVDAALRAAAHCVDVTYRQPERHHNPMETSGTLAHWDGDQLTVWDATQVSSIVTPVLAAALGIDPSLIRIHAKHVGGGFGAKAFGWPHEILAAASARIVGRPVRLHLRRADQYTGTGHQPEVTQHVTLGAATDGHLTALRHLVRNTTAMAETYVEPATEAKAVYACPNISTRQEVEHVNTGAPTAMRAPMEGTGLWALEGAMNELAAATGIDPLELRLRNHADTSPVTGQPWSSKRLRDAYRDGAELFGWDRRHEGSRRDGAWILGSGMATCSMGTFRFGGNARVRLSDDGSAVVQSNIQDIGTGTPTLLCQIAADALGIPFDRVRMEWGDSLLPVTGPMYGSGATVHTGSAVILACRDIRDRLAALSSRSDPVEALREAGLPEISADGSFLPGGQPFDADGGDSGYAMRTFGAIFVEVGVDPDLGIIRLRRAVGAYSAGRIMNARTARSQMIGGIIWGWGKAAMEHSVLDPGTARWLSKNLSGVHIPVNADIPSDITIHFVDEVDEHASPIGAKGIGELGAAGVDAAVADAVFDAVGVRVRQLPITPQRLLGELTGRR